MVEDDRARARRPLIERENVGHGRRVYNGTAFKEVLMAKGIGRELLAEFLGTFVLIVFGVGVVAQTVLSKGAAGTTLSINIAWGLGVAMGCYVCAGVTGAHLNPAVTLTLAVHRRFPLNKVGPYALAQVTGAVVASAVGDVAD